MTIDFKFDEIGYWSELRLKKITGFNYVPVHFMRNTRGATVYYVFCASHNSTVGNIITEFSRKRRRSLGIQRD